MYIYPIFVEGIKYSTIEKVDGNWQLTSKNKFLYTPNTQKITAVKQKNQNDFWIIIHGYGESEGKKFLVYELNESGLDTITKQELEIGNIHNGTYDETSRNNGGYMKVSSDGSKIALAIPYDGIVEVFNFDNETGMISEFKSSLPNAFNMPYGIEFSPDNKLLYFSTAPTETNTFSQIYQLNLEDADCFTNYEIIADLTDDDTRYFGALQLGVDGKIYVANYLRGNNKANNLNIINNPNRIGNDCNFGLDGLPLTSNSGSFTGLPNFVTSFLDIPHFSWINQCATQITYFNLRNETNVGTPEWKYGSASETGSGVQGSYTFSQPGNYTVSVTENYNGISYPSYERNITIHPLPPVELGGPVLYILPGSSVTLDAGEFDEYLWEPDGSTERYIDVSEEGVYKVTVTDTNCCVNEDQIEIKLAKIYFPTAFKPTSSVIQNATFKCLGDITAMLNFNMKIFNRWGQMVFSSDDPDKGWDGTFSGGDAEVGVYVWVINYSSTESRYQTAQSSSQRGTVTLLR
jgi:gliding motility-associated-like protein